MDGYPLILLDAFSDEAALCTTIEAWNILQRIRHLLIGNKDRDENYYGWPTRKCIRCGGRFIVWPRKLTCEYLMCGKCDPRIKYFQHELVNWMESR